jgi:SSS family solute:Na+ symporter
VGIKGGWLGTVLTTYPSEMAQNFWTAIWAWTTCFVITILVSLVTKPRPDAELRGLVYSLTERPAPEDVPWWKRPAPLAGVVLAMTLVLNIIFF